MNSIIFFIFFIKLSFCSKILIFPLKLKFPKINYMSYSTYNSFHFINEYYKKELILEMNIGTPSQKLWHI